MVNQELIKKVQKMRKKSMLTQEIQQELGKAGYNPQDIAAAVNEVSKKELQVDISRSKTNKVIIAIIIIGIIIALSYFITMYFSDSDNPLADLFGKKNQQSQASDYSEKLHKVLVNEDWVRAEADVTIISNCGYKGCFEDNFEICEPAISRYKVENVEAIFAEKDREKVEQLLLGEQEYTYTIVGMKNGKCQVKTKYLQYPVDNWVNKEMVCDYDNKLDFDLAVNNVLKTFDQENSAGSCQGELYDIMKQSQVLQ